MSDNVTIITTTQGSRVPFLEIAKLVILDQTYKKIMDWVIVDGSKSAEDSAALQAYLDTLKWFKYPIVRVPYKEGRKIGGHRNAGNDAARGAIIVWIDDDDYYQPEYISHVVFMMNRSRHILAGCGPMFIYDLYWRFLSQNILMLPYATVNNCLSYRREYLKNHRYDEEKTFNEEPSFTGEFKEPLVQLDPLKCVVQMSHRTNTVLKHEFMMSAYFGINIGWNIAKKKVKDLIPARYLKMYEATIGPRQPSVYDIVYYAGLYSICWDPESTTNTGSEQAVIQLSKCWARAGYKVAVYGRVTKDKWTSPEGVDYYSFKYFHPWQSFNVLILWRLYAAIPIFNLVSGLLSAKKVLVDTHDNAVPHYELIKKGIELDIIDKVMFKSDFHVQEFNRAINMKIPENKVARIMNGLQLDVFRLKSPPIRDPYRFCYASSYDRGLIPMLKNLWPLIVQLEPRAELHVYYGLGNKSPEDPLTREFYSALFNSVNICDHGRRTLELVSLEKNRSTFHLYLTDCPAEIDSISVRESLVAGCIPVLLNAGVFAMRDGLKFDGTAESINNKETCAILANALVHLIHNPDEVNKIRDHLSKSDTIVDWETVSKQWLQVMDYNSPVGVGFITPV